MGAKSRNKGAAGERELARLLREHLGDCVTRNWQGQAAKGGHDLDGLPFALEVKRYATATDALKRQWWAQTFIQAKELDIWNEGWHLPALAYRENRQGWRFVVPLKLLCGHWGIEHDQDIEWAAEISLKAFCQLCREIMNSDNECLVYYEGLMKMGSVQP